MNEEEIKQRILVIEKLINGHWIDEKTNYLWIFEMIAENDREGYFTVADDSEPTRGIRLKYEIIWVNDELILLDIIQPSIARRTQHKITIDDRNLVIDSIDKNLQPFQIVLNRG
jgi:hypothetical protein